MIEKEFESLEAFEANFAFGMTEVQSDLLEQLIELIDSLPQSQGLFMSSKDVEKILLKFEQGYLNGLSKGKYSSLYKDLLKNFDNLEEVTKELAAITDPKNARKIIKYNTNPLRQLYANNLATTLGRKETFGINVFNPLKNIIFEHSVLGLSVQEAKEKVFSLATNNNPLGGKLKQYAGQVAHDALYGFNGSLNKGIGELTGAKDVYYIGGIVRDSRPQCVRWVSDFNGFIPEKDLKKEIAWANKNGEGYSKHLPKLTVETFAVVRGGHNCKHSVKYTNGKNDKIVEIKNRYEALAEDFENKEVKSLDKRSLELYEKNKAIIDKKKSK